ncbi:MAG: tetratricopeptide (TPR) repeat protein, partial [Verrucomicrobiales bacterium]
AAQRRLEATTTSAFEALLTLLNAWRPNDGQDISTWAKWEAFAPHAEAVFDRTERRQDPESALGLLANFAGFETCRNAAYARAEPLMRRALAGSEREFGPDATHTLTSVNNLGFLLQTRGDLDGAEPLFRRDLEASERVLGPEHPATLISVNNLGLLLQERGDLDGAEPLYRRALEASERVLGPEHPDTLSSVNNLGFLRYLRGDMDGAEPLYRRAYEGCQQSLGDDHPTTKIYRRNWEICVAEMKEKSGEE